MTTLTPPPRFSTISYFSHLFLTHFLDVDVRHHPLPSGSTWLLETNTSIHKTVEQASDSQQRQQGGRRHATWCRIMGTVVGRAQGSYAARLAAQRVEHAVHRVPSPSHSRTNHVLALPLAKIFLVTFYRTFHKCPIKFASFLVGKQASNKRKGCRTELRMG